MTAPFQRTGAKVERCLTRSARIGPRGVVAGELAGLTQSLAGAVPTHPGGAEGAPVRFGVPENAKPAVIALVAQEAPAATLVLVPSASRAQAIFDELTLFLFFCCHCFTLGCLE